MIVQLPPVMLQQHSSNASLLILPEPHRYESSSEKKSVLLIQRPKQFFSDPDPDHTCHVITDPDPTSKSFRIRTRQKVSDPNGSRSSTLPGIVKKLIRYRTYEQHGLGVESCHGGSLAVQPTRVQASCQPTLCRLRFSQPDPPELRMFLSIIFLENPDPDPNLSQEPDKKMSYLIVRQEEDGHMKSNFYIFV